MQIKPSSLNNHLYNALIIKIFSPLNELNNSTIPKYMHLLSMKILSDNRFKELPFIKSIEKRVKKDLLVLRFMV